MRIRSVHPVTFIMLLACCLIGCDSAVFDDLSDCPQGVNFHFTARPLADNFPIIRQISGRSEYLPLTRKMYW